MSLATTVAAVLFLGVIAYAVFAGADFGCGIWDLTAGDAERGGALRARIDHSIGPVWEANHVWLIFVLVFLWTGFPRAFVGIFTTLVAPLAFAVAGIVLRGSAFAFRKFAPTVAQARIFGSMFALSSVLTPFFLGAISGAIAAGRVGYEPGDPWRSWTHPASYIGGTLAVVTCAFLAATFLAADAMRDGEDALAEACRRRAVGSGLVAGAVALACVLPLRHDAPRLFDGLTHRALPVVMLSAVGGGASLVLLWRRRYEFARVTAFVAVASVVAGWGVAQYPDFLPGTATIDQAAGARAALVGLLVVFGLAVVTVVPSLAYLFSMSRSGASTGTTHPLPPRRRP